MNDNNDNENINSSMNLPTPSLQLTQTSMSPHVRYSETTATIMSRVLIALLPSLVWAVVIFGYRALTLTLISVTSCVLFEFLCQKIMRRTVRVGDLSAVVSGMLIAFVLPVNAPLWTPVIGAAFAIIIVKQLFGGIGKNIFNPTVAAWVFLYLCFDFMRVFQDINEPLLPAFEISPEIIAETAVPLVFLKDGVPPPSLNMLDMILGQHSGYLGEISSLLLLAGGIYLIVRKVITWHIPISFIGTVALIAFLFPQTANHVEFTAHQILSGGLILTAFFMATDYSTSPISKSGKLIFGVGCGLITISIRYFASSLEGVFFAIMIMNTLVWYIDRLTKPIKFGGVKAKSKPPTEKLTETPEMSEASEASAVNESEGEE